MTTIFDPNTTSGHSAGPGSASSEVDPMADIVAGTGGSGPTSALEPGGLTAPLWRLLVTSGFGPRLHPIRKTVAFHRGTDYGARHGTRIRAAADGVVVWASDLGPYGLLVVLDHGEGVHTCYGHQSNVEVTIGSHVARGQVIGRVGSTGLATGPHLHFEVRADGLACDPEAWLTRELRPAVAMFDAVASRLDGRAKNSRAGNSGGGEVASDDEHRAGAVLDEVAADRIGEESLPA